MPHSDGRVGVFGHSYDAWAAWMLMGAQPPSLAAAFVSGMTPTLRSMTFGIFETGRRLEWTYTMAATDPRSGGEPSAPRLTKAEATRRWRSDERGKYLWWLPMAHLPERSFGHLTEQLHRYGRNPAIQAWDLTEIFPRVKVPVMQVTGWWDRLIGTVENHVGLLAQGVEALKAEHRLMIGPWGHDPTELHGRLGPVDYGSQGDRTYAGLVERWFNHQMRGIDDGFEEEEPVQMFVLGENRWRGESLWPPDPATELTLHLHSAGASNTVSGNGGLSLVAPGLDSEPPLRSDLLAPDGCVGADFDVFSYDPRDPVMSLMREDSQVVPVDQSPHDLRQDVLVYQTRELEADLELIGVPILSLWAATDGPDTDWTAKISQVLADGTAINLTYGIMRASHRLGFDHPTPLGDAEVFEYTIQLNPVGVRFRAGERLRLSISSSDFPNFDRNHNTGAAPWTDPTLRVARQTIFHSPARPSRLAVPQMAIK